MSRDIPISLIDRDETQPRQHFDQATLDELAQSIAGSGLAVPILVRPVGERFVIVHGERRYRAVCSLGWATIPADVRDLSIEEAQWLALVENIQRANLSPIEEARAYQTRLAGGITQEALGQRIGKTQSYIATKLRFLKLPPEVQDALDQRRISEGHAKQLLRVPRAWMCRAFCEEIIARRMSVRESAALVEGALLSDEESAELAQYEAGLRRSEQELCTHLTAMATNIETIRKRLTPAQFHDWAMVEAGFSQFPRDATEQVLHFFADAAQQPPRGFSDIPEPVLEYILARSISRYKEAP